MKVENVFSIVEPRVSSCEHAKAFHLVKVDVSPLRSSPFLNKTLTMAVGDHLAVDLYLISPQTYRLTIQRNSSRVGTAVEDNETLSNDNVNEREAKIHSLYDDSRFTRRPTD